MDSYLLDGVVMDPSWLTVLGVIAVTGMVATSCMLVRQTTPRVRIDLGRVARRQPRQPLSH